MNISYNWLKDLIAVDIPARELGDKLTRVGLAVEGVHEAGDDLIFDIDLTSNRPDCLSHLGVAREASVFLDRKLNISPAVQAPESNGNDRLVTIEDPELCPRFTARILRGVKIGPSPQWLAKRLEAIGERSINNVADITNYVMHELGQPMHSFDLDKLAEGRIVVRRARSGETIQTLDEAERSLTTAMLAICDAEKPSAVAGIMGELHSSITEDTTNVLLEVAYFKRDNIRNTSRALNLATEASYRFERGVDIENLLRASERAAKLICELAGGEMGELVDVYPIPKPHQTVQSTDLSAAVRRLTGLNVENEECERILSKLGIERVDTDTYLAPTWRHDIAIEEDLVEEIARHTGYENIASELPAALGAGEYQETELQKKRMRQVLTDIGFDEAISYSFINTAYDNDFELIPGLVDDRVEEKYVTLRDSVIEGAVRMRATILPGLLDAVRHNFNHQRRDVRLFELGKVFASKLSETGLPTEQETLTMVLSGGDVEADRALSSRELDFFDAKGAVEAALEAVGSPSPSFEAATVKHLRDGQAAKIILNGRPVGAVGRLADDIAANYKFRQPVYCAEIDIQSVLEIPHEQITYAPLARFPSVIRDVSFTVKRTMSYADVRRAVLEQNFELCKDVMFVDIYEGKGLADDERSLTIRIEYRSDDRTLVESEVEDVHQRILEGVENSLGVLVRG